MGLSIQRLARNQALFREVNERLKETQTATVSLQECVCECSDAACTKSLAVATGEYEAVRKNARHFLVARGHELPEVERVVEDNERYLVVEKTVETGFVAETDPRSPDEGA